MFSLSKTRHLMASHSVAQRRSASAAGSRWPCAQHLCPETCLPGCLLCQISQHFPRAIFSREYALPPGTRRNLSNKHLIKDNIIINSGLLKFQCRQIAICLDALNREQIWCKSCETGAWRGKLACPASQWPPSHLPLWHLDEGKTDRSNYKSSVPTIKKKKKNP